MVYSYDPYCFIPTVHTYIHTHAFYTHTYNVYTCTHATHKHACLDKNTHTHGAMYNVLITLKKTNNFHIPQSLTVSLQGFLNALVYGWTRQDFVGGVALRKQYTVESELILTDNYMTASQSTMYAKLLCFTNVSYIKISCFTISTFCIHNYRVAKKYDQACKNQPCASKLLLVNMLSFESSILFLQASEKFP